MPPIIQIVNACYQCKDWPIKVWLKKVSPAAKYFLTHKKEGILHVVNHAAIKTSLKTFMSRSL